MATLAEELQANHGHTIEYRGHTLQAHYSMPVARGDTITVEFLLAQTKPVRGLGIRCEDCKIGVADLKGKYFVLWRDTAPNEVLLRVLNAKVDAHLTPTNLWRDEEYGTTMYCVNNAAIEALAQPDGSVVLRCSDGWGEADFDDLVVRVTRRSS